MYYKQGRAEDSKIPQVNSFTPYFFTFIGGAKESTWAGVKKIFARFARVQGNLGSAMSRCNACGARGRCNSATKKNTPLHAPDYKKYLFFKI